MPKNRPVPEPELPPLAKRPRMVKADAKQTVSMLKGGKALCKAYNDQRGCRGCEKMHACDIRLPSGQACLSTKHNRLTHPEESPRARPELCNGLILISRRCPIWIPSQVRLKLRGRATTLWMTRLQPPCRPFQKSWRPPSQLCGEVRATSPNSPVLDLWAGVLWFVHLPAFHGGSFLCASGRS